MTTTAFDHFTYSAFPVEKYQRFLDTYVRPHAPPTVEHVLDLGCGSGGLVERLSSLYPAPARFLGIDISRASIDACRAREDLPRDRVRFLQADVSSLREREELRSAFDLVTSYSVLHFVPGDTASKLHSLARLTRPGGVIAIDALAKTPWNRAMFGLVKLLIRTGLWGSALRLFRPIIGPTFPRAFIEELARMTYLKHLRYADFVDLSYLDSAGFREHFELLKLEVVPQDGFFTGRKARFTMRRRSQ